MPLEPLAIGVCSWSLQVTSVPELKRLLDRLGVDVVQIACGDPHHASWDEGDAMPEAAQAAGLPHDRGHARLPRRGLHHAADDPEDRRLRRPGHRGPSGSNGFEWALDRTRALGLTDLMLHAGFIPEPGDPDRKPFLDTLGEGQRPGAGEGDHGRLRDGPGDGRPAAADARRPEVPEPEGELRPGQHAPLRQGRPDPGGRDPRPRHPQRPRQGRQPADGRRAQWGEEVPLGQGQVNIRAVRADAEEGRLHAARCASSARSATRRSALRDIAHGVRFLRECLA